MITIDYLANHRHLIPELTDLAYAEWKPLYDRAGITPDRVRAKFTERAVKDRLPISLVALEENALVGMRESTLTENTDPDLSPWLSTVYVKEAARGRGIGSKIVRALERRASELGVKTLYLSVEEAVGFYRKLGWTVLKEGDFHGQRLTVIQKRLRPRLRKNADSNR